MLIIKIIDNPKKHCNMKRFKIIDPSGRTPNKSYETLQEVVNELKSKNRDISLQTYYIYCKKDDIEITADELLEAFSDGETPQDLSFF